MFLYASLVGASSMGAGVTDVMRAQLHATIYWYKNNK
jgi:hypothetical protein